jgi:hypothetical protein
MTDTNPFKDERKLPTVVYVVQGVPHPQDSRVKQTRTYTTRKGLGRILEQHPTLTVWKANIGYERIN